MKINDLLKKARKHMKTGWGKHGQLIMTCVTIGAACGAVYEAVKASKKSVEIKEEREERLELVSKKLQDGEITEEEAEKQKRETNFETVKDYAVLYSKTGVLLTVAVGSTILNYREALKTQAGMLAAYKLLETKKDEIEKKTKDIVGEKKYESIKSAIVKDHLEAADVPDSIKEPEYEVDKDGNQIAKPYDYPCWFDALGQSFTSNTTKIRDRMSEAATVCKRNGSITINEIAEILGGEEVGLRDSQLGENHGFIASQLVDNYSQLPYDTEPVMKSGYNHSFIAIKFDEDPVLLAGYDCC